MNREIFINSKLVENLGWTLVHSIWQIALIALVLFLVLRGFNKLSANARYLFAAAALGFAFILPFATFVELQKINRILDENAERQNPKQTL